MATEWTDFFLSRLAREITMEIRSKTEIIAGFGLTDEQYAEIEKLPYYVQRLKDISIEWNSTLSTNERNRLISASFVEHGLPMLGARMTDPNTPPRDAVEFLKAFGKIAGLGEPKTNMDTGGKFVININLGEDKKLTFEKDITPLAITSDNQKEVPVLPEKETT
jgi:hypothetical protein